MQKENLIQISGTVETIIYKNEETGFTVLELDHDGEPLTVVGELASVGEGEALTLHGSFRPPPRHGPYKSKPGQKPQLRFDIHEEVGKRLPGFPIVLHGASSVPQDRVAIINQFGGKMPDAIGIPEDMLRKAATMAVCKINIDSDLRVACTAAIRKHLFEHPDHFDPRQYLGDARAAVKEIVRHKIVDVLGSENKA